MSNPLPESAVVTGAASGIGQATARRLARRGLRVVCVDIDGSGANATAAAITDAGGTAVGVCADVADDAACRDAVMEAGELGSLSTVCNVAGISPYRNAVTEASPEQWDRVMAVNVRSVYSMVRHSAPVMAARGGGVVVNTASVHAYASHPGCAPYAASKGALVALTRQLAIDLIADSIRVVAVAPGSVDTAIAREAERTTGQTLEQMGFPREHNLLGRVGTADEVAAVIAFLASTEAAFVTGTTIVADGGLLARLSNARVST